MNKPPFLFIAASCIYVVVLAATIYFTRAGVRRVAGALLGGVAVSVAGIGIENLAHRFGWWRYPSVDTPYGPPLIYPVAICMFASLALIAWRVTRRFGWRGQVVFLTALTIVGTLRDYAWDALRPDLIVIAPGFGVILVDAACWFGLAILAQAVMRWVAGPVGSDSLARLPASEAQIV